MSTAREPTDDRLVRAKVLVELRELHDAESEVLEVLRKHPESLTALNLYAKIKHMRGDLSQAVTCWAELHARSPHNEVALTQLAATLQLAQDPARATGEFLALGRFRLLRKPAAQLALEEAFRLFLARHPVEARMRCVAVANEYRQKDRDTYKLAMMANAWIAELSGELAAARTVLESLGNERGFDTDIDRLLSLVRIYEQLGTPTDLRSAAKICRHLEERFGKISILGRLGALYRRLGQAELARTYDRRFLQAFRHRMHRPTFGDVVRVAAQAYVPLPRLRAIDVVPTDSLPSAQPRERAVAAALAGRGDEARALFLQCGSALDRKYLADLLAFAGDEQGAVRTLLLILERDPADVAALSSLLERYAGNQAVPSYLADPSAAAQAKAALREDIRLAPLRPAPWRRLATLHRLLSEQDAAGRCDARADLLEEATERDARAVGRALSAAVYHFAGKAKGLIHEVWAGRQRPERGQGGWLPAENILGNVDAEMRESVRNTFLAVREYARAKLPHLTPDLLHFTYSYKVTKEDEQSGGQSAGLPTALAFLSVFLQRPVPQDLASSGVVVADAHDVLTIGAIGEAEYKVKGAYHRNLRMLLLPRGNRAALSESSQLPAAICDELVRYVGNLDEAVRLVFGDDIFLTGT